MLEANDIHNLFRKTISEFLRLDPHLSSLNVLKHVHHPALESEIPVSIPGVYIVTGGRQVGKSTLLKLMIRRLVVEEKVDPRQVYYLPCDALEHFSQLLSFVGAFEESIDPSKPFFLFVDEITYVKEWDRAVKVLADRGFFRKGSAILTGSDTVLLKEAMMRFPGRRGAADRVDFHLFPLSYLETVSLYDPSLSQKFAQASREFRKRLLLPESLPELLNEDIVERLYLFWDRYLVTGGFLTAINALASSGSIPRSTYRTYLQWIQGDLLKRGKNPEYARELLGGLMERLGSQLTWHSLTSGVSIEHHQTIADYVSHLERMDVVLVLNALREDKMRAAPKKARKIHFADPFIFHAARDWCLNKTGEEDPFSKTLAFLKEKSRHLDHFVEGAVGALARRNWEAYYLKAEGEVDLALVFKNRLLPIEIKWSPAPYSGNAGEFKQLFKYKNGIVASRTRSLGTIGPAASIPIPVLALLL